MANILIEPTAPLYSQINQITNGGIKDKICFFTPKGGFIHKFESVTHFQDNTNSVSGCLNFTPQVKEKGQIELIVEPTSINGSEIPLPALIGTCTEKRWEELKNNFFTDHSYEDLEQVISSNKKYDLAERHYAQYILNMLKLEHFQHQNNDHEKMPPFFFTIFPKPLIFGDIQFQIAAWHCMTGYYPLNYPFYAKTNFEEFVVSQFHQLEDTLRIEEENIASLVDPLCKNVDELALASDIHRHFEQ